MAMPIISRPLRAAGMAFNVYTKVTNNNILLQVPTKEDRRKGREREEREGKRREGEKGLGREE